ncbi:hypothetical protein ACO0M4_12130 [Streptomyces sp. RGM 3693]|uniref:hypothetical protein n=1 Tax=Streptomyces sp. RGM 3693 TaxID=3413284 RepID=UPI003D299431
MSAVKKLNADGNGADRQRTAYRRRQNLIDVVDYLLRTTAAAEQSLLEPPQSTSAESSMRC